jgi:hypothetical protein
MEIRRKHNKEELIMFYFEMNPQDMNISKLKLPEPYFTCTFFFHNSKWGKEALAKAIKS